MQESSPSRAKVASGRLDIVPQFASGENEQPDSYAIVYDGFKEGKPPSLAPFVLVAGSPTVAHAISTLVLAHDVAPPVLATLFADDGALPTRVLGPALEVIAEGKLSFTEGVRIFGEQFPPVHIVLEKGDEPARLLSRASNRADAVVALCRDYAVSSPLLARLLFSTPVLPPPPKIAYLGEGALAFKEYPETDTFPRRYSLVYRPHALSALDQSEAARHEEEEIVTHAPDVSTAVLWLLDSYSVLHGVFRTLLPGLPPPDQRAALQEESRKILHESVVTFQCAAKRYEDALKLREENDRYRRALERIAKWVGEFPSTGLFYDDDPKRPVSYAGQHGPAGERDYMRNVALSALQSGK